MDVINPEDKKAQEEKSETPETAKNGSAETPVDQAKVMFANFEPSGKMTLVVELDHVSHSAELFYRMRGFIDSIRDQCLAQVQQRQVERAKLSGAIHQINNKQKTRGFLNNILRR